MGKENENSAENNGIWGGKWFECGGEQNQLSFTHNNNNDNDNNKENR